MTTPQPVILSNIKNIEQLLVAKALVKQQCTAYEGQLKVLLKELPANALKAAAVSAVKGVIMGGTDGEAPTSAQAIKQALVTSGMELLKVLLVKKSLRWVVGLFK
jgi:hypothetical protein